VSVWLHISGVHQSFTQSGQYTIGRGASVVQSMGGSLIGDVVVVVGRVVVVVVGGRVVVVVGRVVVVVVVVVVATSQPGYGALGLHPASPGQLQILLVASHSRPGGQFISTAPDGSQIQNLVQSPGNGTGSATLHISGVHLSLTQT
jgi:hypothetical protein